MSAARWKFLIAALLFGLVSRASAAQERPVTWRLSSPRAARGALIARLDATIADGWYLYSLTEPPGGPVQTTISVLGDALRLREAPAAPDPERRPDRNFNIISEVYTDSVQFALTLEHARPARDVPQPFAVAVRFQTCTNHYCLPPRTDTVVALITSRVATNANPLSAAAARAASPVSPAAGVPALPARDTVSGKRRPEWAELPAFLWLAVTTGLLALLTPCVFPMIPITVGFFTRRGEGTRQGAARDALLFSGGIIASFTALGLTVSALLGAGNIVRLAANPWLNLVVAALFLLFALQLAGWLRVRIPYAIVTRLSVATAGRRDAGALLLMGATFSLTSFTCTAPFTGSLLVLSSRGDWLWPLLGLAAYATVFALPFFVLALFPQALGRLPRSGSWLASLKGVVAFLELAAVVKFAANADLVWGWGVLTRETVLALWLVIAVALAAWLIATAVRVQNADSRSLRGVRLALAVAVLVVAARVANGLGGAGLGEIEAYLPPPRAGLLLAYAGERELEWRLNDLGSALALAKRTGRPVLVDFTGYTCTNCRWMEANMFTRPQVRVALARFVRARLYTDGTGAVFAEQQALEQRVFGTVALPLYAVYGPDGVPAERSFVGMTRSENEFLDFLAKAGRDRAIASSIRTTSP
jgi:thiol:disulfide interchange protein DsbD